MLGDEAKRAAHGAQPSLRWAYHYAEQPVLPHGDGSLRHHSVRVRDAPSGRAARRVRPQTAVVVEDAHSVWSPFHGLDARLHWTRANSPRSPHSPGWVREPRTLTRRVSPSSFVSSCAPRSSHASGAAIRPCASTAPVTPCTTAGSGGRSKGVLLDDSSWSRARFDQKERPPREARRACRCESLHGAS
jgi:hypothetical protein